MPASRSNPVSGLSGTLTVPGDKSISHRSLMLGALAVGQTTVRGLLEGEDVLATAAAMRALGAKIEKQDNDCWHVNGVGVGGLCAPDNIIDMANSGTAVRLLLGLVASHPITTTFTGDASLRSRPMERVMAPLRALPAQFTAADGGRLPITVQGATNPLPLDYVVPVPSAQVKSAVLLAGLNAPGTTRVVEREATRDHTENMLRGFGAMVTNETTPDGTAISLVGQPELAPCDIVVPGDPSSAAFLVVAALITPNSKLRIKGIGVNPLRTGLFETLREMGGDITFENERIEGGEPVADLLVKASELSGIEVPPERAPSMIDEYPVLAVASAFADGKTTMRGLAELRVKESDRLDAVARGLRANGVALEELEDGLIVRGCGNKVPGGGTVETFMDHRIAMAFLVMGCATQAPVTIDEDGMIATSFPNFLGLLNNAGAAMEAAS